MKFRTILESKSIVPLSHKDKIITLGSCFADQMGQRLLRAGFDVCVNPLGTVFNSISLAKIVHNAIFDTPPTASSLGFNTDTNRYYHFDYYTRLSGSDIADTLTKIQEVNTQAHDYIKDGTHLFVTLGTSHVYQLASELTTVSNCHKLPGHLFVKNILSISEQLEALHRMMIEIRTVNPNLAVHLTVSPVRHVKDGIAEDRLSKSILRVVAHEATLLLPNVHYYPAYELITDDLRDYRYFAEDLIHPNNMAVQYIWEHFCSSYMSVEVLKEVSVFERLNQWLSHHPYADDPTEKVANTKEAIDQLRLMGEKYTYLNKQTYFKQFF